MWKILIGDFNSGHKNIGIPDLRYKHLSDLIHDITENGHRHASGPVPSNIPSVTYIGNLNTRWANTGIIWILDFYYFFVQLEKSLVIILDLKLSICSKNKFNLIQLYSHLLAFINQGQILGDPIKKKLGST